MPSLKKTFSLVLKSDPKEILKVEKFLAGVNSYINLGEVQFHNLLVATTEAVNNGIIHGNQRNPKKAVKIICTATPTSLEIRIHDEGTGIVVNNLPDPLDEKNLLRENGRGIFLMRNLMDSVIFKTDTTGNEVVMKLKKGKQDS
jgi:serine/threonine-protein kinase RsbW